MSLTDEDVHKACEEIMSKLGEDGTVSVERFEEGLLVSYTPRGSDHPSHLLNEDDLCQILEERNVC